MQVQPQYELPQVTFPEEGITLSLRVTRLGENLYRLDDVPFGIDTAGFRDLVEAERTDAGLTVVRRIEASCWQTVEFAPRDSATTESVLATVERIGGDWRPFTSERLVLCLPPGYELERILDTARHLERVSA